MSKDKEYKVRAGQMEAMFDLFKEELEEYNLKKEYEKVLGMILKSMDLPPDRKIVNSTNLGWLASNLKIANKDHKDYTLARILIEKLGE
jgi:hypothetical protein